MLRQLEGEEVLVTGKPSRKPERVRKNAEATALKFEKLSCRMQQKNYKVYTVRVRVKKRKTFPFLVDGGISYIYSNLKKPNTFSPQ